jgi:uncharacterized protein
MSSIDHKPLEPLAVIREFYRPGSRAYEILLHHSRLVSAKALEVAARAAHLKPDRNFIREAALLHDIGIFLTDTPELGCRGRYPYICHGYLGRELLEKKRLMKHALVSERHVGIGLSIKDIRQQRLPLPERNMCPVSIEEQIICYSDKFFSKNDLMSTRERSLEEIVENIEKYGLENVKQFKSWNDRFAENS